MKKYLKSGFNTTQNIKLEAGTYSLVAYVKSLYGNTYTFALGYDGAQGVEWTEYDVDVVKNQLCKVWFTFTIREKIAKLKPISSSFSASLPVYVADLQLTRGNVPVESGASPFDFDEIINDVEYDYESKIEQAANKISLAVYNKTLDNLDPETEIKLTSDSIKLSVASALSPTGIDIEEGTLTLYSGAKDGNPGGQIIIAGSNFSVDTNGKVKAVDGEFSGKITATEGSFTGTVNATNGILDNVTVTNAEVTGIINANSGSFTGALASPFERTKSTYTKDFSNNLIVTGSTFILPWDQLGSGRLIRLIQPNPGTPYCTAPSGKHFYEDGEQKSTLTMLGAEIIELLGYTDSLGNFTGWLVLNRGLLHTASTWGEPHRIVAHGRVKTSNPFKYHTFDGSTLTITIDELSSRWYTSIIMPTKWFDSKDGYYVKIIANGGDSSAFHIVDKLDNYNFLVSQHSLNASGALIRTTTFDFYFEIYSAAWIYPKSVPGGGGGMPGEEW